MAKKRKLSDLVREEIERPEPTEPEATVTDFVTPKVTELETSEVPKYLTLVRKEARLREEQLEQLTNLTRKLNRQRQGTGERITENTLIRVAIDLLLSRADSLCGATESELREALGLEVTE